MILRNRLKERRAALNVNQQEMGALCGVSRQTISLIERGTLLHYNISNYIDWRYNICLQRELFHVWIVKTEEL